MVCGGIGWDAYQSDHEDANGQYEINFVYDDALVTADRYTFFKMMTSQYARSTALLLPTWPNLSAIAPAVPDTFTITWRTRLPAKICSWMKKTLGDLVVSVDRISSLAGSSLTPRPCAPSCHPL